VIERAAEMGADRRRGNAEHLGDVDKRQILVK
jgi:hypothetical protein